MTTDSSNPMSDTCCTSDSPLSPLEDKRDKFPLFPPTDIHDWYFRPYAERLPSVEELYRQVDSRDYQNKQEKLDACHTSPSYWRDKDCTKAWIETRRCNDRWCPVCAGARQAWSTDTIAEKFEQVREQKMLVLTLAASDFPLSSQFDYLTKSFNKFRKRKLIRNRIAGGAWFIQNTWNWETSQHHPHLHLLLDSVYIDKKVLAAEWFKCTGNSYIIDIREIYNTSNAVKEVARYSATPCDLRDFPPERYLEVYDACFNRKMCGSWGTLKGISFKPKSMTEPGDKIQMAKGHIVFAMRNEDDNARAIWLMCTGHGPVIKGIDMDHILIEGYEEHMNSPPKFDLQSRFNFAA